MVQGVWVAREEYGGWLHVYSLILAVAVFLTISVIAFRFWRRRLPWRSFELGVLITLPFGVLGASFFGKLDVKHPIFFPTLFAFWQPGLSIHGGILVGAGAGFIFYHFESKRYLISKWVYCDAIFPAIFLGQAVGRWGNFFNHELFGPKISYGALKWLPAFLRNSLFRWYYPDPIPPHFWPSQAQGLHGQATSISNFGQVQYYQPLFLYESIGDLLLFVIIVFGLPYVWQYFGWRLFTKTNKRQALTKTWTTYLYRYYYQVELPAQQQTYFQKRSLIYQFQAKYQHHREQMKALSRFCYFFRTRGAWLLSYWHSDCSQLSLAQNPFQLSVLRTGVQGALWWAGYNLLRLSLEWLRRPQDFFIPHLFWLDLTVLVLLSAFGGGLIYLAQVTSPRKWRLVGWLYEKQY